MRVAPTGDESVSSGRSKAPCPRCGTPPDGPILLTAMTSYYVCGRCAGRWSVTHDWLAASIQRSR